MTAAHTAIATAEKDRVYIVNRIKQLISSRHINVSNPRQDYRPWLKLIDQRGDALIRSANEQEFERGIRDILNRLGSSHTAFFHIRHDNVPALYSINATLRAVDSTSNKRWMFLDVIEDGAASRAGIKPGEFLLAIDSRSLTPPDIATFRIGGKHQLDIRGLAGQIRQVAIEIPDKRAMNRPPMVEPRSLSHRMITGDVGLTKIATFPGAVGLEFARNLDLAMQDLKERGMKRLIIDIRGNVGGGLGSLRLMSYLCPNKLEIGYSLTRRRLRNGYRKEHLSRIERIPANKPELALMALRFGLIHRDRSMVLVTEALGAQAFHGRIVLLVNDYTHSAAEMVASFAKEHHLATLVGSTTAGEVLGGANFKLRNGYRLRIPTAGWYTWNGDCIEGKGVEPDVILENSPESLAAGIDAQLEKAKEVVQGLE
jgi:C-terminal processing protease CtpA/Prc